MEENYKIYKFTFSDGKVYIGQTCQSLEERWANGEGYKNQDVYVPIVLEGWNNIQKEILHTGLTSEQADLLEQYYINKFDACKNGYNRTNGGKSITLVLTSDVKKNTYNNEQMWQISPEMFQKINKKISAKSGAQRILLLYFIFQNQNNDILPTESAICQYCNMSHSRYNEARAALNEAGFITYIPYQEICINYKKIME